MNKLTNLFIAARKGLSPYDRTPDAALTSIANQCGRDEIASIHIQLKQLKAELIMCPEWDGDTQDQIWLAIQMLRTLMGKIEQRC